MLELVEQPSIVGLFGNQTTLGINEAFISKFILGSQTSWAIQSGQTDSAEICLFIAENLVSGGARRANSTDANMSAGVWYHITLVYNGDEAVNTDRIKMYLDGSALSLNFIGVIPTSMQNSTAGVEFARFSTLSRYNDCNIEEAGFWKGIALSQAEAQALANPKMRHIPLQVRSASLVALLPLDDHADGTSGDGLTYKDITGRGNDGVGDNGANNTGLTNKAGEVLSYPGGFISIPSVVIAGNPWYYYEQQRSNSCGLM
jgi:hypothetical protein